MPGGQRLDNDGRRSEGTGYEPLPAEFGATGADIWAPLPPRRRLRWVFAAGLAAGALGAGALLQARGARGGAVNGDFGNDKATSRATGGLGLQETACAVNVILVRHCDKVPRWGKHPTPTDVCTVRGELRGIFLAKLFGPGGRYPVPTRLFGRRLPDNVYGSRDLYLLWPLAFRLGLNVNTSFADSNIDVRRLAQTLLSEREAMCREAGGDASPAGAEGAEAAAEADRERPQPTVLVSWNHCSIPALAQVLGCQARDCTQCWDDSDYEKVLWLRFEKNATANEGRWRLRLRAGTEGFDGARRPPSVRGAFEHRQCDTGVHNSIAVDLPCALPESADNVK